MSKISTSNHTIQPKVWWGEIFKFYYDEWRFKELCQEGGYISMHSQIYVYYPTGNPR